MVACMPTRLASCKMSLALTLMQLAGLTGALLAAIAWGHELAGVVFELHDEQLQLS